MPGLPNKTVLVVEDEKPLLEAIRQKFESVDIDVVTARSVQQALDYLESVGPISAIWLDHYLLGKEDGLHLVAKVKENDSRWSHIPVFVVSNTASDAKMHTYLSLGVKDYFVKADHRLDEMVGSIAKAIKAI